MIKYFPRKTTGVGREGGGGGGMGEGGGGGGGMAKIKILDREFELVSQNTEKFLNRIVFISLSVSWVK